MALAAVLEFWALLLVIGAAQLHQLPAAAAQPPPPPLPALEITLDPKNISDRVTGHMYGSGIETYNHCMCVDRPVWPVRRGPHCRRRQARAGCRARAPVATVPAALRQTHGARASPLAQSAHGAPRTLRTHPRGAAVRALCPALTPVPTNRTAVLSTRWLLTAPPSQVRRALVQHAVGRLGGRGAGNGAAPHGTVSRVVCHTATFALRHGDRKRVVGRHVWRPTTLFSYTFSPPLFSAPCDRWSGGGGNCTVRGGNQAMNGNQSLLLGDGCTAMNRGLVVTPHETAMHFVGGKVRRSAALCTHAAARTPLRADEVPTMTPTRPLCCHCAGGFFLVGTPAKRRAAPPPPRNGRATCRSTKATCSSSPTPRPPCASACSARPWAR